MNCLITGASSGIGAATAERYASEGKRLILWARRRDHLEEIAKRCREFGSPSVEVAAIDVRNRAAIRTEIANHSSRYAEIDVLVNNAGLARGLSPFQEGRESDFDDMIDTNIKGFLNVTQAILPGMLARNRGHLVHLGSVAGRWVYPKGHVYCASKAAVAALTQGIRLDLNGTAIRITEIAPGMVETDFNTVRLDAERAKAIYRGMTPLLAVDIADAIVWATSRPAHVNIQEMVIYPVDQASPTVVSRRTESP